MKFDELDNKMRVYETANDHCVVPGMYMVARIDGRSFTRLTKEVHQFEAPFDLRFRDNMVETARHLMNCGFRVIYGFTESDEISLLLHPDETLFSRKLRKYHSVLAGEASAKFSLLLGDVGVFDCRISQLPSMALVADYFRWRNEDAFRNALNAHCYWMMRKKGATATEATAALSGRSVAEKNEYLFQNDLNFNDLPNWQKRGIGLYWEAVPHQGKNPTTGEIIETTRKQIRVDYDLPMKDEYGDLVLSLCRGSSQGD